MAETEIGLDLPHLRQRLFVFEMVCMMDSLILAKIQISSPPVIILGPSL